MRWARKQSPRCTECGGAIAFDVDGPEHDDENEHDHEAIWIPNRESEFYS